MKEYIARQSESIGDPVGRCIYCGISGGKERLGDEHIFPYSLGGLAYLRDASCKKHEGITSYLEGYVAKEIFGLVRLRFGMKSRRKIITLSDVPVTFLTAGGIETRTKKIPASTLPKSLALPLYSKAGMIPSSLVLPWQPKGTRGVWTWRENEMSDEMKSLMRPGEVDIRFARRWKGKVFMRFLAKVAHSASVAIVGIDGFAPFLPKIILDPAAKSADHFIGTQANGTTTENIKWPEEMMEVQLHRLTLETKPAANGEPLLIATVQLFSFLGAPTYHVFVGIATPKTVAVLSDVAPQQLLQCVASSSELA